MVTAGQIMGAGKPGDAPAVPTTPSFVCVTAQETHWLPWYLHPMGPPYALYFHVAPSGFVCLDLVAWNFLTPPSPTHTQANTVPATFWSLAFLLLPENAGHREEVARELQVGRGYACLRVCAVYMWCVCMCARGAGCCVDAAGGACGTGAAGVSVGCISWWPGADGVAAVKQWGMGTPGNNTRGAPDVREEVWAAQSRDGPSARVELQARVKMMCPAFSIG